MEPAAEPIAPKKVDANVLAENRTVAALERTMMAWIRTDLSLISFGFTMFKFLEIMDQSSGGGMRQNAPRNLGMALIFLGVGTLIMAMIQFRKAIARITSLSNTKPQISISTTAAAGILLVAFAMLLNMWGVWN
jgi:putative membrane protein